VALYQLSIVIGILLAFFSNTILLDFSRSFQGLFENSLLQKVMISEVWRAMFGAEMLPALLFTALLFFVPESPRWLIKSGFEKEGFGILAKISDKETAKLQLQEINEALQQEEGTLAELIKPGLRLALIVGVGLSFFGQFTGVNIVVYYGPTILENAGFKLSNALQFQVAIGIINFIFTVIALWKIDKWGRRPLLIGGMAATFISLLIIALQFTFGVASGIWIVIMLCVYMASLALSINAVIWVLIGEIFPNRIRGRAMSIATFANWGTNFITAFIFPWYVAAIGMNAGFFTFAGMCFIATLFFYRYVPKQKAKVWKKLRNIGKRKHSKNKKELLWLKYIISATGRFRSGLFTRKHPLIMLPKDWILSTTANGWSKQSNQAGVTR
jgi:SP family arabinose:H+ symporter-like MFS transporter